MGGRSWRSVTRREAAARASSVSAGVIVRPATAADLPGILAIERAVFSDPWTPGSFRGLFGQPHVLATVAVDGDAVTGYAIAWVVGDEAELANLAVAPARRGTGIAKALLDGLLASLDAQGGAHVYLEVRDSNAAAQALYRSRGFTAAGRRKGYYTKPDEDAVIMRRARGAADPRAGAARPGDD